MIGLILLPMSSAWAWGPLGHNILSEIADARLRPDVKTRIRENFNIKNLADVANWADRVKRKRSQGPWHYCNIAESERGYSRDRDCPDDACVVEKVRYFAGVLRQKNPRGKEGREALMYLVHFVGDIHQPLHLGNAGDRGGNAVELFFRGKATNLHALWDGGMIHLNGKSLLQYARHLNRRISPEDIENWTRLAVTGWANESRAFALDHAYLQGESAKGSLSKEYIEKSREIIDLRLSQAGVRLADLLNRIFE